MYLPRLSIRLSIRHSKMIVTTLDCYLFAAVIRNEIMVVTNNNIGELCSEIIAQDDLYMLKGGDKDTRQTIYIITSFLTNYITKKKGKKEFPLLLQKEIFLGFIYKLLISTSYMHNSEEMRRNHLTVPFSIKVSRAGVGVLHVGTRC